VKRLLCKSGVLPTGGNSGKLSLRNSEMIWLVALLLAAFLTRFLLFSIQGYNYDLSVYAAWIATATDRGLRSFYGNIWCDYPPFNVYIFYAFGNLAKLFGFYTMATIDYVVKFIPTLFDLATASLIYVFVRKRLSLKLSLATTAIYAFNPAVIYNSAVWGQFDAVYTFFLILLLMLALKSKPKLSAAVFALSVLTKPQAIALAPLIAFLIYKKNGLKNLIFSSITFALCVFVVILPFNWSNPVTFLSNIYFGAYGDFKNTSVNAFNIWGLVGFGKPDGNLFILGWGLFGALIISVLYILHKRFDSSDESLIVFCAFLLLFGFFMLPTRIHERYLFPAISMLALTLPFIKKTRLIYAVLTGTLLLNQAYVLSFININLQVPSRNWVDLTAITINVFAMAFALVLLLSYGKKISLPKINLTLGKNKREENLPYREKEKLKKSKGNFFA
jgi:Gpi18-like mannosyltransferase